MKSNWSCILCKDEVTASVAGTYQPADKKVLGSSFAFAVNTWLKRYERRNEYQDRWSRAN